MNNNLSLLEPLDIPDVVRVLQTWNITRNEDDHIALMCDALMHKPDYTSAASSKKEEISQTLSHNVRVADQTAPGRFWVRDQYSMLAESLCEAKTHIAYVAEHQYLTGPSGPPVEEPIERVDGVSDWETHAATLGIELDDHIKMSHRKQSETLLTEMAAPKKEWLILLGEAVANASHAMREYQSIEHHLVAKRPCALKIKKRKQYNQACVLAQNLTATLWVSYKIALVSCCYLQQITKQDEPDAVLSSEGVMWAGLDLYDQYMENKHKRTDLARQFLDARRLYLDKLMQYSCLTKTGPEALASAFLGRFEPPALFCFKAGQSQPDKQELATLLK